MNIIMVLDGILMMCKCILIGCIVALLLRYPKMSILLWIWTGFLKICINDGCTKIFETQNIFIYYYSSIVLSICLPIISIIISKYNQKIQNERNKQKQKIQYERNKQNLKQSVIALANRIDTDYQEKITSKLSTDFITWENKLNKEYELITKTINPALLDSLSNEYDNIVNDYSILKSYIANSVKNCKPAFSISTNNIEITDENYSNIKQEYSRVLRDVNNLNTLYQIYENKLKDFVYSRVNKLNEYNGYDFYDIDNLSFKKCGIYKIENTENHKCYIGQALDICDRWKQHIRSCKNGDRKKLYTAMREFGMNNFTFSILEECSPMILDLREYQYIQQFDAFNNGYNSNRGNITKAEAVKNYMIEHNMEKDIPMSKVININYGLYGTDADDDIEVEKIRLGLDTNIGNDEGEYELEPADLTPAVIRPIADEQQNYKFYIDELTWIAEAKAKTYAKYLKEKAYLETLN